MHELVVMADAVGGRLVLAVLPVDLEEARHLSHVIPLRRLICRCSVCVISSARARRYSTGMTLRNFGRVVVPVVEDFAGARRAGVLQMVGDELAQALGVEARHVAHDVDAAVAGEIAALMVEALVEVFLLDHRLEIDHRHVAARRRSRPPRRAHRRCRPTCRPRNCARWGRARRRRRRSCIRSRDRRRLRPPRSRRNCAPRSARPRRRGNRPRRKSRRRARCCRR